jgi:superfamily II DNA or RNA helicase
MASVQEFVAQLQPGVIVGGALLPEPVEIITAQAMGASAKIVGRGTKTNLTHQLVLAPEQLAQIVVTTPQTACDGDAQRFRLGVEALRLGLAYEYDPLFSLSIARVDPLPHQLEAVYDYFLKLPRIRFLLADDPGAGKTIMAGLLIKELKIRGLARRILIVTPANLSFQWQREMREKFREGFEVIRGDVLRANYGANPWQEKGQVITSVSWVSRIEDARESLLRSHWDLVIVDEAHKMSATSSERKTLAYQLGEKLSEMTDHYLLMTATPHKGEPEHFRMFLELLDKDVYGDIKSLQEAMQRRHAPFYLRRVKEALVKFPDPQTGEVQALFTKRIVATSRFRIDDEEWDFYDRLTRYVEDQSIKAAAEESARGRAVGFTMAMLQRRFASSVRAAERSLGRMREKRQKILDDPEAYRRAQVEKRLPSDFDDLPDEDQVRIEQELEGVVASVDRHTLREEIRTLDELILMARRLEQREEEAKLRKLRTVLQERGIFTDEQMKLLIFTEHKDTLDYLVEKLREWGLTVTQIHGGMKIGDRNTPHTRIYAEQEFHDTCQVMVATEAAGEGINLQFCWLMINYDIPWNPVRLEQRMGRIHRYGQEKDCLVFNFVATNTREGQVLQTLFDRLEGIEEDLDPEHTGKVFNVLGDVFPANELEQMLRQMYARNLTQEVITDRIVKEVDLARFRRITNSTLEGLAQREINLAAIVGRTAEAKERRLVPEVIEDFFNAAAPLCGIDPRETRAGSHVYRVGRLPRSLWAVGDGMELRFGKLGREYKQIVFDKNQLVKDATLEWVTPGHPLFESVRMQTLALAEEDLRRGAVFYDLNHARPVRLNIFGATIRDGRGKDLHRRLFVVETALDGAMTVRQPTVLAALHAAPTGTDLPAAENLPSRGAVEALLFTQALMPFREEVAAQRAREVSIIAHHTEVSLNAIINRVQLQFAELLEQKEAGSKEQGLEGRLRQSEDRLDELNHRLARRQQELEHEALCAISDVRHIGQAWVLPHPERAEPNIAPLVRDDAIERIAIEAAIAHEEARGWQVQSVESEDRGFDLISRRPHPEDPQTAIAVRFIEVKGRAGMDVVPLTTHEYSTAERLKDDYWLYTVFNCATQPEVHCIQNPARLAWVPLVKIEHYTLKPQQVLEAEQ